MKFNTISSYLIECLFLESLHTFQNSWMSRNHFYLKVIFTDVTYLASISNIEIGAIVSALGSRLNSILRKQLLSKFEAVEDESVYWIPCVMTWNGVCIRALPQKFPIRMLRH